jgi:hypothetical protein
MIMNTFEVGLETNREAEQLVLRIGGLPEITRASTDLIIAIAQTRTEIADATFDEQRFPARLTTSQAEELKNDLRMNSSSPLRVTASEQEGLAGVKRFGLDARLNSAQTELMSLLRKIVEIRADLIFSQTAFEITPEAPVVQDL